MSAAKPKVKVAVMLDSIQRPGGGETLALEGAIRLDPQRFERWLCLTRWDDAFERTEPARTWLARLREAGVEVVGLRRRSRLDLGAWRPLIGLLRRERIDVLHAHLFGSNVWAVTLGRIARVPVVVAHEHMWAYSGGGLRPLIDRELIARFSNAFIAVSKDGMRRMIEVERIDPNDVVYIPNGIPELPAGDPLALRRELSVGAQTPVIGSVGHLRVEKAFEVLVEAAALLAPRFPDLRVVIAGEGVERARLEALRAERGLDRVVALIGARDDIPDVLAALDVAVCCSDFEGSPLSVMEYMGARLPVVATRVGGLPELIRDGSTGSLVAPRDPVALADALAGLLDDPGRRRVLGEAGRQLVRSEYGIDRWVDRLQALYLDLLER